MNIIYEELKLTNRYLHCERKIKYKSKTSAQNYIKKVLKKKFLIVENIAIYKCCFCNKYHIGHYKKSKLKKILNIL